MVLLPQVYIPRSDFEVTFRIGVAGPNRVNEAITMKFQIPFDGSLPQALSSADLWDYSHFSVIGSKRMAEQVYAFLNTWHLIEE